MLSIIRFTSFLLLGFMLFSLALRGSIADSHHEKMPVEGVNPPPATKSGSVSLDKEISSDHGVPPADEVKETRIGGRKMRLKWGMGKEMVEAEGGYGGGSQISGAAHFVGNCNHKFSNRSPHDQAVKVNMGGFIAFSADYHVPKPHPPKNN